MLEVGRAAGDERLLQVAVCVSTRRLFGATDGPSHFGEQQLLEHDVVVFFGDLNYASTASPARSWRHVAHLVTEHIQWMPYAS